MSVMIRYTPLALNDMDAVWDGVVEASFDYDLADRYVNELADVIAAKKDFPRSGVPLYFRGLFTGFYSVHFKAYKAFYRVEDGYIEVVRILLAKADYMKILFRE